MAIKTKTTQSITSIRTDLSAQLESNGTLGAHYLDLVEEYIKLLKIRRALQKDMNTRGVKVTKLDSRGQKQLVTNDSIKELIKVTSSMMQILNCLGVQASEDKSGSGADEDEL